MASLFKSTTTYDPIFALLNADTRDERDRLTEKWRDHKLSELNFIGIVGPGPPFSGMANSNRGRSAHAGTAV
ncbi:hypothetical protein B9Z65_7957 [Elsinoe australis]|uniref:Uncharacterized protein n=1 Tax=Elsinoe australis TaxID=40998 RepID=A0A2P7YVM2_9PEZI|nr:hypothetical protein B9Z65_7957 [Elsinoe australis]